MQLLIFFLLISYTNFSCADPVLPASCKLIPVGEEAVLLISKDKPTLFLLHNISDTQLWLIHPAKDGSANAGFSSFLQIDRWSALLLPKKKLKLNCIESKPGHEQTASCNGLISVSRCSTATIPNKHPGIFWVAENLNLQILLEHLSAKGFELSTG